MERAALALDRRQAALADGVRGTVRISIYEVMAQFLTEHLVDLRDRLPEIEIEMAVAHISANLSRREADLSLRECLPDAPGLIAKRLGQIAYAVYGAGDYVEAHPAARSESRYRACAWVSTDEEHNYFAGQQWLLDRIGERRPQVRVNNEIVLYDAVRKGVGLGILPCFAADADPLLIRLTEPLSEVKNTQHMIVHRDLRRVPSVRAVMDELTDLFEREAPRLRGELAAESLSA
jgi:DNA-binding transcriptional LysR family regulator